MTDEESDMFEIKKWTKQGDPQSSLVFDTVLQVALKEKRGICFGDSDHDCLTNLRFADDVLLIAFTKE